MPVTFRDSQLIREGVVSRVSGKSMYSDGYNDGLTKAIKAIHELKFAQMRFPSGKSFADIVCDDLNTLIRKEEENGTGGLPTDGDEDSEAGGVPD